MPIIQLRTYTLQTAALAKTYAQRWQPTMASISKHNITTRGVYLNETNPKQVIAMVQFQDGDSPDAQIEAYVKSDAFKADMGEIEMSDFEGVEKAFIKPMEFSPEK